MSSVEAGTMQSTVISVKWGGQFIECKEQHTLNMRQVHWQYKLLWDFVGDGTHGTENRNIGIVYNRAARYSINIDCNIVVWW